jgi:uncharacterized protein YndB with AHSA1/START domain
MKHQPLIIEHTLNAPVEIVWKAITDKDQMKHMYFDLEEFKPEVGFEFQFEGRKDDQYYLHLCKITEVVPGKKLSYSWRYDGYEGISYVTFELFEEENHTRLKLTHEGLESFPPSNPDLARESFEAGWMHIIGTSLKNFVETDTIKKWREINASADRVWAVLVNPEFTRQWGNEFSEGAFVETDWATGSEVLWKDKNGEVGAKGIVEVNDYLSLLKVIFYEDVNSDINSPTGNYYEQYALSGNDGKTMLSIEAGPLPLMHIATFDELWDKAISKMKELAEQYM